MRAWLMDSYDGVEKLRLGEVADPVPGPKDVLVRVLMAGLNPADAYLAQAMYPAKPSSPHILGRDGAGEVLAVGPEVRLTRLGDRVGILRGDTGVDVWGTFAEKVVVPASNVTPIPSGWSLQEMAGAPLIFLTAWQALTQWSQTGFASPGNHGKSMSLATSTVLPEPPPTGSVLLITGASGGVGTAALLLGRSMDLTVVALSRSKEKGEKLRELGADHVLDPTDPNLSRNVLAAIAPRRVDLAVDMVGGPLLNEIIGLLGKHGRISVVGRSGGAVPEFNTARLFFRRNRIGGVAVSDFTPEEAQRTWSEIVRRLDAIGKRPVVDRVFPFEELKSAFAHLDRGPLGKVLVRVSN